MSFFLGLFGMGQQKSKKNQKNQKKIEDAKNKIFINPLKNIKMFAAQRTGSGPKKTECQDVFCVLEPFSDSCYYFAVYDGHGTSGKEAASSANDYIQTYLEHNDKKIRTLTTEGTVDTFLRGMYKSAENKLKTSGIDYNNSGSCVIAVFVRKNQLFIANLGDSRAVLFRINAKKDKMAIELSHDQKPTRKDEKERILKSGGKVERLMHDGVPVGPHRVWADEEGPGIAMTRTLGDWQAQQIGLISEPEIKHLTLTQYDQFIVIGSDGLWDHMTSAQVCGFVAQHDNREKVAEDLVLEARGRWEDANKNQKGSSKIGDVPTMKYGIDDITCVIAYLEIVEEQQG